MIVLSAPIGLAALAVARTAALHRRIRTTGTTGVTARQQWSFWAGLVALFGAAGLAVSPLGADRPMTTHVLQFVLVALAGVPLLMISLPEWWVRRRVATLRVYRLARRSSTPWFAGLAANVMILATHLPWTVSVLPAGATGSFVLVVTWMIGGALLWLPVWSPFTEHRVPTTSLRCAYLVGAAGLTPLVPGELLMSGRVPVLGLDATGAASGAAAIADQHVAGALLHLVAVPLVWAVIAAVRVSALRAGRLTATSRRAHPSSAPEAAPMRRRVDPTH